MPCARAAAASVVSPYSHRFENGDHAMAPGCCHPAYTAGSTAPVCTATKRLCRQPACAASVHSRDTIVPRRPSAQW